MISDQCYTFDLWDVLCCNFVALLEPVPFPYCHGTCALYYVLYYNLLILNANQMATMPHQALVTCFPAATTVLHFGKTREVLSLVAQRVFMMVL